MARKLTFEYVKQYFSDNECELLEEDYINAHTKMKYICKCKKIAFINFNKFQQGQKYCIDCCGFKKYTQQEVEEYFKSQNCELLDIYKNNNTPMKFKCECGEDKYKIRLSDFKFSNQRCKKCSGKRKSKSQKFSHNFVKDFFEKNDCKLLDIYSKAGIPMRYICNCGNESTISYNHFRDGIRCYECGIKKISGSNNYNWNPDRDLINENKKFAQLNRRLLRDLLDRLGIKKETNITKLVGYNGKDLEIHLKKDLNYNEWKKDSKAWVIDHIIPINYFKKQNIKNPCIINALDNLRIISAKENLSKKDFCLHEDFLNYMKKFDKEYK